MRTCPVTFTAGQGVRRFEARHGRQLVVGRSRQCDLHVNSPRLSRRHCAVSLQDQGLVLDDLGSSNGTFVNGRRVSRVALRPGDIVQLGGIAIRVDFDLTASQQLDLRCERCGQMVSMARCEDGQVFELGAQFVCAECAAVLHHQALSHTERHLAATLTEEGFHVEEKSPLSSGICPVFRVRRVGLDTRVDVKALPLVAGVSPKKVARFQAEARAAAKVRHPNVVEIYDIRQVEGALYIVMEHVEGELLRDRLERKGPLPLEAALRTGLLVARALRAAHGQGIIHRDLKPGGIVIDAAGVPKVMDFGLAKDMWALTGDITGPEETLGTVRYMPPEQVKNAREADDRADIYSLGATLFHALTGRPPYHDMAELDLMSQVLSGTLPPFDPTRAEGLPPQVGHLLGTAMAYEREQRFPTAVELEEAVTACIVDLLGVPGFTGDPELLLSLQGPPGEAKASGALQAGGMAGVFSGDELLELLQMVEFNHKSGTLEIRGEGLSGHLAFQEGRIKAAVTGDGRRGQEAVAALVGARGGRFNFQPRLPQGFLPELDASVSSALLEAARRRDEEASGELRRP